MANENERIKNWQQKSHQALLKLLNNIGIIGAVLCGVADIIFVIIMVIGINVQADFNAIIIFAIVNAVIGLLINGFLRYQGQKYAEVENEKLCEKFYNREVKEHKYISMGLWTVLVTAKDIVIKGCTTSFSIFGLIYITVQGSHNPIQILLTLVTLILFACFGLIAMNSAYVRYYNIQVPYMKAKIEERENNDGNVEDNIPNTGNMCDSIHSTDDMGQSQIEIE